MLGGAVGEAAGAAQVAKGGQAQLVLETQLTAACIKSGCCARDRCARSAESQRIAGVIGVVHEALVIAFKVGYEFSECEFDVVVAARLTCPRVRCRRTSASLRRGTDVQVGSGIHVEAIALVSTV